LLLAVVVVEFTLVAVVVLEAFFIMGQKHQRHQTDQHNHFLLQQGL
jgi:hypothetical protein